MSESVVDQSARDLATRAVSLIEQHQAVCMEAEKHRTQQIAEMSRNLEGWMQRIQTSNENAWTDISQRNSTGINTLGTNLGKNWEAQQKINNALYNRFWTLLWSYAAAMTMAAAVLLAHVIKI